jgi:hypothetical protein
MSQHTLVSAAYAISGLDLRTENPKIIQALTSDLGEQPVSRAVETLAARWNAWNQLAAHPTLLRRILIPASHIKPGPLALDTHWGVWNPLHPCEHAHLTLLPNNALQLHAQRVHATLHELNEYERTSRVVTHKLATLDPESPQAPTWHASNGFTALTLLLSTPMTTHIVTRERGLAHVAVPTQETGWVVRHGTDPEFAHALADGSALNYTMLLTCQGLTMPPRHVDARARTLALYSGR